MIIKKHKNRLRRKARRVCVGGLCGAHRNLRAADGVPHVSGSARDAGIKARNSGKGTRKTETAETEIPEYKESREAQNASRLFCTARRKNKHKTAGGSAGTALCF